MEAYSKTATMDSSAENLWKTQELAYLQSMEAVFSAVRQSAAVESRKIQMIEARVEKSEAEKGILNFFQ
jgi:hypothetical protein